MGPIYESALDRSRQLACTGVLESNGWTVCGTNTLDRWDLTLFKDGVLTALAEFKWRDKYYRKYGPLKIDTSKIDSILSMCEKTGLAPILIIQWSDLGYFYWNCRKGCETGTILRTKPRDVVGEVKETRDPCYVIPLDEFKRFG